MIGHGANWSKLNLRSSLADPRSGWASPDPCTPARDSDGSSPRLESKSIMAKQANPLLPGDNAPHSGPGFGTRRQPKWPAITA